MEGKRSSRRLLGLAPQENGLGVCLICQADFRIEELQRLRRTDCCQALFHRRCFRDMMERSSCCPACRHEHESENPRALKLPEDIGFELEEADLRILILGDPQGTFVTLRFQVQVSEEINEYRQNGLPAPHRPGSAFRPILPYFIPKHYFFTNLTAIESFSQMYVGDTLYLHGFVVMPVSISIAVRSNFFSQFALAFVSLSSRNTVPFLFSSQSV